jgi:hypothetical protein
MDSIVRARLRLSRDKLSSPERDASFGQALRGNTAFGMPSSRILAFSNRKKKPPLYRFRFSEDFCVGVRNGYRPGQQPKVS